MSKIKKYNNQPTNSRKVTCKVINENIKVNKLGMIVKKSYFRDTGDDCFIPFHSDYVFEVKNMSGSGSNFMVCLRVVNDNSNRCIACSSGYTSRLECCVELERIVNSINDFING